MSTRQPLEPYRRVILAATIHQERGYVPFTLSTVKYSGGRLKGAEVLLNSSMRFAPGELAEWTPLETIFVISNALVLPGDEVWYTPEL